MNPALVALLERDGCSEETALGVARVICNLDKAQLLATIEGRADLAVDRTLPLAVSAFAAPGAVCAKPISIAVRNTLTITKLSKSDTSRSSI